jgi:hypothetical protein
MGVNTAQLATILKSAHSKRPKEAQEVGERGRACGALEDITPFSPSMTRSGLARRLGRSSIIDGCAAA